VARDFAVIFKRKHGGCRDDEPEESVADEKETLP